MAILDSVRNRPNDFGLQPLQSWPRQKITSACAACHACPNESLPPDFRNTMNYRNSHPFCKKNRKISCPVTGSVLLIMAPKAKHSAMLSCTGGVGSQWRLMATTLTAEYHSGGMKELLRKTNKDQESQTSQRHRDTSLKQLNHQWKTDDFVGLRRNARSQPTPQANLSPGPRWILPFPETHAKEFLGINKTSSLQTCWDIARKLMAIPWWQPSCCIFRTGSQESRDVVKELLALHAITLCKNDRRDKNQPGNTGDWQLVSHAPPSSAHDMWKTMHKLCKIHIISISWAMKTE